jgi:hypothetical protein
MNSSRTSTCPSRVVSSVYRIGDERCAELRAKVIPPMLVLFASGAPAALSTST